MTASMVQTFGLYVGTYLVCFGSGLIPLINAEVFLIFVSTVILTSAAPLPAIVILAALGQMTAKIVLYYAARGVLDRAQGKRRERLERARARVEKWRERPLWVLLASATFGLPPFYIITLLAGALRIRLRTFLAIGTFGRLVRFAVLVALPWM